MNKRWREWTYEERMRSRANAAYLFLNMATCQDCGLPWPEGYVHFECPGPEPIKRRRKGVIAAKGTEIAGSIG